MKTRAPKAADIDDRAALCAVIADALARDTLDLGACWWTLAERTFPQYPEKVVAAKLRQLNKRGLIDGCSCGCRGDYTLTARGRSLLSGEAQDSDDASDTNPRTA